MTVAVQSSMFGAEHDGPDVQIETFWNAREILEGLQSELCSSEEGDEKYGADLALVWVLVNDCCKLIHGEGVG